MGLKSNLGEKYSPTLFLAALGNGGLAVGMYVYLHFMIKHMKIEVAGHEKPVKIPLATYGAVKAALAGGNLTTQILVGLVLLGILVFAFRHFFFLVWNIKEYNKYRHTQAFRDLVRSNREVSLAAIPLTFSMSINVMFVLAGVFVPGLWNYVEYLFPFALLGFTITGAFALKIFIVFMTRILASGDFDCTSNNNLAQMVAVFAFAMVGVGFAAPGAMSTTLTTSALGIIGSTFFLSLTVMIGMQSLFIGFRAMMQHGINKENSPTLWIVIPIITLIGISVVRVDHGLHMNLGVHTSPGQLFTSLFFMLSLQIVFGIMGWYVMKQVGYFEEYINGEGKSNMSYALICPGVAFHVFGMFVLHMGLVKLDILPKFGLLYWILLAGLVFVQLKTIFLLIKLDRKLILD